VLINNKLPKYFLLHGIPYLAYVISFIPFYLQSPEEKIEFAEYIFLNNDVPRKALLMQMARIVHITIYISICLVLVMSFQRRIKDNFSDIEKITLNQVKNVLYFFLFTLITAITTFLLGVLFSYNYNLPNNIIGLSVSLIIYAIALTTWNRKSVEEDEFATLTQRRNGTTQLAPDRKESKKTRSVFVLNDQQYDAYSKRLEIAVESEKVFVENEISLTELSKKLGIQPYQLSELISRVSGESFFEYINRHRIEEIKTRLKDPKYNALSLLGVAMDCGFNSKSSFNTAFKKYTGLTPSEYRKQVLQ
jgi:AraC-like DNA-binding protein